jgi:signal transduction histidine kinase
MRYVAREVASIAEAQASIQAPFAERIEALKPRIDDVLEGAERVRRIVSDLKTFSRGDEEGIGPIDVHGALNASLNIAANQLRHRAKVVRCYGDVPFVQGNDKRLGQIFLNLLINAAQAIPDGDPEKHEIRVTTAREGGGRVVVEISDTGSGIPPEIMEHIFDPFFTTKPAGVGTGLGLWICQRIVTGLGGEITVESDVSAGTTVRVKLPSAYATPSVPPPAVDVPAS